MNLFVYLEPLCYPEFNRESFNISCSGFTALTGIVADLNSDNQVELIIYCNRDSTLNISFWNNYSHTFQEFVSYSFPSGHGASQIFAADMNNDAHVDLILADSINGQSYVSIIFGNGNGTFQIENIQKIVLIDQPTDIAVADINKDNNLDVIFIISYTYIYVFWGNGNEISFSPLIFDLGCNIDLTGLAVNDFNNDNHLDIAVLNLEDRCIHIYFGYDNGSS